MSDDKSTNLLPCPLHQEVSFHILYCNRKAIGKVAVYLDIYQIYNVNLTYAYLANFVSAVVLVAIAAYLSTYVMINAIN